MHQVIKHSKLGLKVVKYIYHNTGSGFGTTHGREKDGVVECEEGFPANQANKPIMKLFLCHPAQISVLLSSNPIFQILSSIFCPTFSEVFDIHRLWISSNLSRFRGKIFDYICLLV